MTNRQSKYVMLFWTCNLPSAHQDIYTRDDFLFQAPGGLDVTALKSYKHFP